MAFFAARKKEYYAKCFISCHRWLQAQKLSWKLPFFIRLFHPSTLTPAVICHPPTLMFSFLPALTLILVYNFKLCAALFSSFRALLGLCERSELIEQQRKTTSEERDWVGGKWSLFARSENNTKTISYISVRPRVGGTREERERKAREKFMARF